jgi:hypothetical protein
MKPRTTSPKANHYKAIQKACVDALIAYEGKNLHRVAVIIKLSKSYKILKTFPKGKRYKFRKGFKIYNAGEVLDWMYENGKGDISYEMVIDARRMMGKLMRDIDNLVDIDQNISYNDVTQNIGEDV